MFASIRRLEGRRGTSPPLGASRHTYRGGALHAPIGWPHHGRQPARVSRRGTEAAPTDGAALARTASSRHSLQVCRRRSSLCGSVHPPECATPAAHRRACCVLGEVSACMQRSSPYPTRWHLTLRSRRPAPAGRVWPLQGPWAILLPRPAPSCLRGPPQLKRYGSMYLTNASRNTRVWPRQAG